jgi:hypothetical protein
MNRFEILKHPERTPCTSEEADQDVETMKAEGIDVLKGKSWRIDISAPVTEEMKRQVIREYMQTSASRGAISDEHLQPLIL